MNDSGSVVDRVVSADCCAGCGLCASIAPEKVSMSLSAGGFLRPTTSGPLGDTENDLIAATCPGAVLAPRSGDGHNHPLWGPIQETRVGASTDPALRHHASSGGALSALLNLLLDKGVVDRVVHVGTSRDLPIGNQTVVSRTHAEVFAAAGSRYGPSAPLESLLQEARKPGRLALVGKPCDIAAARALAARVPDVADKIPVMLSFFCAGVPSLSATRRVLARMSAPEEDVQEFRYRGDGWPGLATAVLKDGSKRTMTYAASWGDILSRSIQFRCKICPDGSGGYADIVCGDAWHSDERGYPMFEDQDGRSLIVTRSSLGEKLVRGALDSGYLEASPVAVDMIARFQPGQKRRNQMVFGRLLAMFVLGRRRPVFEGFGMLRNALGGGLVQNLQNFAGTFRRLRRRPPSSPRR